MRSSSACGSLDILINNAGITRDQLLLRMKDQDWESVLATNLNSVFYCTRAALKWMLKSRFGRVVSLSSVVGVIGNAGQANYGASKAGIIGFTKCVAQEVASRGITVNAVAPGYIRTGMTDRISLRPRMNCRARFRWAHRHSGGCGRGGDIFSVTRCGLYNRSGFTRGWRHGYLSILSPSFRAKY